MQDLPPHGCVDMTTTTSVPTFAQALARRAASDPQGELVRVPGVGSWTGAEIWARSRAWAAGLAEVVRRGDVVATAVDAGPDAIALTAAISCLGGVEMPLAPDMPEDWVSELMVTAGTVAVVASSARITALPELAGLAALVPLLLVDGPQNTLRATHPCADGIEPLSLPPEAPALIMTTSGTTGRTKAALLPVGAPAGQAARVARAMDYGPDDVLLSYFAWHHINARHATVLPALMAGATVVMAPRFSASGFLDLVRAEGVTAFNFMGAVCMMLLAQPPTADDRDHRIRAAYGGPAPAFLVSAFRERFGVTLRHAYACTELGDVATTSVHELRSGAAGRPVSDYDLLVVDETGDPVPDGTTGELLVRPRRSGLTMLEYVGDPGATRDAWHEGWFRTRDRVRLEGGWLHVDGRLGDVIRRRGVNLDPQQIETALLTHPDVIEAAAVAVPSELTEDDVLALVVTTGDAAIGPEQLLEHCRARLPSHALPRYLTIEASLPHNTSLKLDRAALRKRGLTPTTWDAQASPLTRPEVP